MAKKSKRYIVEHSLEGRVKYAQRGCESVENLQEYLETDPHKDYRLVSCQWSSGSYTLVWEKTI